MSVLPVTSQMIRSGLWDEFELMRRSESSATAHWPPHCRPESGVYCTLPQCEAHRAWLPWPPERHRRPTLACQITLHIRPSPNIFDMLDFPAFKSYVGTKGAVAVALARPAPGQEGSGAVCAGGSGARRSIGGRARHAPCPGRDAFLRTALPEELREAAGAMGARADSSYSMVHPVDGSC